MHRCDALSVARRRVPYTSVQLVERNTSLRLFTYLVLATLYYYDSTMRQSDGRIYNSYVLRTTRFLLTLHCGRFSSEKF